MLCLATATRNFKWLKITHICLIWAEIFLKFSHTFHTQKLWFGGLTKKYKNDNSRGQIRVNPYNAEKIMFKSWKPKGFNQIESIINVWVSSFWFIWIPLLWVYNN